LTEPRKLGLKEQLYPMAISDEDLIECWFDRLNEPDIVKELGLSSARELRLHWRRLKELGKLPLTLRAGVEGKFGQDSRRATGERDLLLERLLKVHDEPRNPSPKPEDGAPSSAMTSAAAAEGPKKCRFMEYRIVIKEAQRRLIMRALTNALANDRLSTDGFSSRPEEWMQLIRLFSSIEPSVRKALP
jgi:hypothetical protein